MIINNLVLRERLDRHKELCMSIAPGSSAAYLDEEEAIQLMNHLAEVFDLDSSDFDLEWRCGE